MIKSAADIIGLGNPTDTNEGATNVGLAAGIASGYTTAGDVLSRLVQGTFTQIGNFGDNSVIPISSNGRIYNISARALLGSNAGNPLARQCIQFGFISPITGFPQFLDKTAGSATVALIAGADNPVIINFAQGNTNTTSILSGVSGPIMVLTGGDVTYYIYTDYQSTNSVTWGATLARPIYSYQAYRKTIQTLLRFASGTDTTILDDFGNAWQVHGQAKIQNTQLKFLSGTTPGALGGGGANNSLDGANDYLSFSYGTSVNSIYGSPFGSLDYQRENWSIRCWVYLTIQGTSPSVLMSIVQDTTGCGISVLTVSNGNGAAQVAICLSSDGTTNDLANMVLSNTHLTLNNWHFIELVWDKGIGNGAQYPAYRLYIDGVQDTRIAVESYPGINTITSLINTAYIGGGKYFDGTTIQNGYITGYIDKVELLPYCNHPGGWSYNVDTNPPQITNPNYTSDFFDINGMTMYQVTGPSEGLNQPPQLTKIKRVYAAEANVYATLGDFNTQGITTVPNYALNGQQIFNYGNLTNGQVEIFFHNLGHNYAKLEASMQLATPQYGWPAGTRFPIPFENNITGFTYGIMNRKLGYLIPNSSGFSIQGIQVNDIGDGTVQTGGQLDLTKVNITVTINRTW
jgi:hypothetical protein